MRGVRLSERKARLLNKSLQTELDSRGVQVQRKTHTAFGAVNERRLVLSAEAKREGRAHIHAHFADEIPVPVDISLDPVFATRFPDLNFSDLDGAYFHLKDLMTKYVKLLVEVPTLRVHLRWLLGRVLHFVIAGCPDGHPFIKNIKDGATSSPAECLNIGKIGHHNATLMVLWAVMCKETDPRARAMCHFHDEKALELEKEGLVLELDIPQGEWGVGRGKAKYAVTFEFIEKSDEKMRAMNNGNKGASSRCGDL
jgi:hypothetical protein